MMKVRLNKKQVGRALGAVAGIATSVINSKRTNTAISPLSIIIMAYVGGWAGEVLQNMVIGDEHRDGFIIIEK